MLKEATVTVALFSHVHHFGCHDPESSEDHSSDDFCELTQNIDPEWDY